MANTAQPTHPLVVVGVDGSKASNQALTWAANYARISGAALRVVTSWHFPRMYGVGITLPGEWRPDEDAAHVQKRALDEAAAALEGLEVDTRVVEGEAATALLEATEDAALVVVGSRGHGELAGILIGSVSEYVVAHASVPVVVIHPSES